MWRNIRQNMQQNWPAIIWTLVVAICSAMIIANTPWQELAGMLAALFGGFMGFLIGFGVQDHKINQIADRLHKRGINLHHFMGWKHWGRYPSREDEDYWPEDELKLELEEIKNQLCEKDIELKEVKGLLRERDIEIETISEQLNLKQ